MTVYQVLSTKPYKGTRDFYPDEMQLRNQLFDLMEEVAQSYGYQPYDGPMLESFDIYAAKTGEEIVNEQLYHFEDRGGRKVALRPEMTPTLARMVAAKGTALPRPIRWYSFPNLWRYERPQKGRLREHWQLNVDLLGSASILAEAEILQLAVDLLKGFGASSEHFEVQVNHRQLMNDFFNTVLALTEEQVQSVAKVLDRKAKISEEKFISQLEEAGLSAEQVEQVQSFVSASLSEIALICPDSKGLKELQELFEMLEHLGLSEYCRFDSGIMRGMDYYTGTVFEIFDRSPENRRALFGGGRYDNLVGLFGKQEIPGVGFGMGDVTLKDFLNTHGLLPEIESETEVFVAVYSQETRLESLKLARELRNQGFNVEMSFAAGKMGKQFQVADKKGIPFVALLGPDEIESGHVVLKDLTKGEQTVLKQEVLEAHLQELILARYD